MKFGVIICPYCKKVKGIDLSCRTTKCIRCNKKLIIDKLKLYYKTDSSYKLQQVIGLINADFDGNLKEFEKLVKSGKL